MHTNTHVHTNIGGIALDPTHFNTSNSTSLQEAWALHNACQEIGTAVGELQPDLVLLSTPHGVADLSRFLFYLNPEVRPQSAMYSLRMLLRINPVSGHLHLMGTADCSLDYVY